MNNVRMIDLANRNFKDQRSTLIANTVLSIANDMNRTKISKEKAKNLSSILRESGDMIAKLEASASA